MHGHTVSIYRDARLAAGAAAFASITKTTAKTKTTTV